MKLYIFNIETNEIEITIEGETNEECESKASDLDYDLDLYGWSYSDNGLI